MDCNLVISFVSGTVLYEIQYWFSYYAYFIYFQKYILHKSNLTAYRDSRQSTAEADNINEFERGQDRKLHCWGDLRAAAKRRDGVSQQDDLAVHSPICGVQFDPWGRPRSAPKGIGLGLGKSQTAALDACDSIARVWPAHGLERRQLQYPAGLWPALHEPLCPHAGGGSQHAWVSRCESGRWSGGGPSAKRLEFHQHAPQQCGRWVHDDESPEADGCAPPWLGSHFAGDAGHARSVEPWERFYLLARGFRWVGHAESNWRRPCCGGRPLRRDDEWQSHGCQWRDHHVRRHVTPRGRCWPGRPCWSYEYPMAFVKFVYWWQDSTWRIYFMTAPSPFDRCLCLSPPCSRGSVLYFSSSTNCPYQVHSLSYHSLLLRTLCTNYCFYTVFQVASLFVFFSLAQAMFLMSSIFYVIIIVKHFCDDRLLAILMKW